MRLSPYARAVERAVEIAGGVTALAGALGVSSVLVRACITGSHETPTSVFLKVVDYLMDRDAAFLGKLSSMDMPSELSGDEQSSG
jgi:hypothetical protein